MSSYTTQLRSYVEKFSQEEMLSNRERIEKGRPHLFDFDYPIFDQTYKKVFETNFIRNFYMVEIGFETEELFKFNLETWLLINMPYFNKMFESELLVFDPLKNTELTTEHNRANEGTQNATSSSTGTGKQVNDNFERRLKSDNPDSRLALTANDGEGVIEYASDIQENTDNGTATTDSSSSGNAQSTINNVEDYLQSVIGKTGSQSYSKMLDEYRDTFLRIEKTIFKEMRKELFMLVY
jgi:hypothetical protein